MAFLSVQLKIDLTPIQRAVVAIIDSNGAFLASVGRKARTILKKQFLSGQELQYKSFKKSRDGKRLIASDVNRARTETKIYSFPSNLFETGRGLRSGRKEAGRYIITRKLKQVVSSRMGGYIRDYEKKILEPEMKRAGL